MAGNGKRNMFNEATRVQMPAMVHPSLEVSLPAHFADV